MGAGGPRQHDAVRVAGEIDIGEEQIDGFPGEDRLGFPGVGGGEDAVALLEQRFRREFADHRLVLHDQDGGGRAVEDARQAEGGAGEGHHDATPTHPARKEGSAAGSQDQRGPMLRRSP